MRRVADPVVGCGVQPLTVRSDSRNVGVVSADRPHDDPAVVGQLDQALIEAMPGGVVHVTADGTIHSANAEARRILGLSFDQLTRRYAQDFEPETVWEDGSPCPASEYPVSKALATGQRQPGVTIGVRHPDGQVSWAVFSAFPVLGDGNRVLGAIVTFLDITLRKRAEEELSHSRDLLRAAQKVAGLGSYEWDLVTGVAIWSDQLYVIHGLDPVEFRGKPAPIFFHIHPDDQAVTRARADQVLAGGPSTPTEYRIVRPDGEIRTVWAHGEVERDTRGRPVKLIGTVQDITERRALEEQLRQAQKMESVGLLAGGVAHDFNNLLQVILGNADIALRDPTRHTALAEIKMASERAADLTRQLLAFGRRQPFQLVDLDLAEHLTGLVPLLRRMLGERVMVELELEGPLPTVSGDRTQIEQVLINLCINARDATPEHGTIRIAACTAVAGVRFCEQHPWAQPGRYVEIRVADEGAGMPAEVRARAFEPFFTTKALGHGSGLGLAVVYGIVQQHGGGIHLQSEPGNGTTFKVYLPTVDRPASTAVRPTHEDGPGGGETLLVVEDEPMVRALVADELRTAGYRVLEACDGREALVMFERHGKGIDLMIVDVVMPGMSGRELGKRLRSIDPTLRVLYTTGYAADPHDVVELRSEPVLYKPYARGALLREVRRMLDEPAGARTS